MRAKVIVLPRLSLKSAMSRVFLFLTLMSVGDAVLAASFDCGKAHANVEKLICEDEALSKLDSQLGSAYQLTLGIAGRAERPYLVTEQKAWINNVRDKCSDAECLRREYSSRLDALVFIKLPSITIDKSEAEYVLDQDELLRKTSDFQKDMNQAGMSGDLTRCKLMVRLNQNGSRIDNNASSYGAICSFNKRDVMICNDTMVGKLTVKLYGFAVDGSSLAYFTEENCPYGG